MKTCTRCLCDKDRSCFYRGTRSPDGLRAMCKQCSNDQQRQRRLSDPLKAREIAQRWQAKNKEKIAEYHRNWRLSDPEARSKVSKEYRQKNKEATRVRHREWYENNVEKKRAQSLEWAAKNPDAMAAISRKWRLANPHVRRIAVARRRARKIAVTLPFDFDLFELVEAEAYHLASVRTEVTGVKWHVDHIVPLKTPLVQGFEYWNPIRPSKFFGPLLPMVSGLHSEFNLAVITARDNQSKSNRVWPDMPDRLEMLCD